jgi:hypothetical protein
MMVVDGFVADPDAIRQSALAAGIGSWTPPSHQVGSGIYTGMGFMGNHAPLLRSLSKAVGRPVYPNNMFFRVTNEDTEAAYVQSDRAQGDFTCIVYLSKHETLESGTGFYRHRASGATHMGPLDTVSDELKEQMVRGSAEDWELLRFVPGHYNRAVIFDAPRYHSRLPKHGFGNTAESGRMVWACHFTV